MLHCLSQPKCWPPYILVDTQQLLNLAQPQANGALTPAQSPDTLQQKMGACSITAAFSIVLLLKQHCCHQVIRQGPLSRVPCLASFFSATSFTCLADVYHTVVAVSCLHTPDPASCHSAGWASCRCCAALAPAHRRKWPACAYMPHPSSPVLHWMLSQTLTRTLHLYRLLPAAGGASCSPSAPRKLSLQLPKLEQVLMQMEVSPCPPVPAGDVWLDLLRLPARVANHLRAVHTLFCICII